MSNAEANRAADATILPGHLPHYNKVLTLGDPSIRDLLVGRVVVSESADPVEVARLRWVEARLRTTEAEKALDARRKEQHEAYEAYREAAPIRSG